ncbi:hypothetical protein B0H16DRAFT_1537555 [Mycena metata]|uniref:Uncharacterized protein n=1 Tax=Mycena metata TaxID=1033252 RepID=A0AAD7J4L2_9AGAR|nr:hypothetical protein B0H16DRAFT_1537555 [Mycena metata]
MAPRLCPARVYDAISQEIFTIQVFSALLGEGARRESKATNIQFFLFHVADLQQSLSSADFDSWFARVFGPLVEAGEKAFEEPPAKKAKMDRYARALDLVLGTTALQQPTVSVSAHPQPTIHYITPSGSLNLKSYNTAPASRGPDSVFASSLTDNESTTFTIATTPSLTSIDHNTSRLPASNSFTSPSGSTPTCTPQVTSSVLGSSVGARTISAHEAPEAGHVRRVRALITARSIVPSKSTFAPRLDPSPVKMPGAWPASPKRLFQDKTNAPHTRPRTSGPRF